jgi:hypothetical protein
MKRRDFLHSSLGIAALWPARHLLAGPASAELADIPARTLSGTMTALRGIELRDFAASLRGQVFLPHQPGYDQARRVWNAMFDKQPAVIARCASPSDAMRAGLCARASPSDCGPSRWTQPLREIDL